MCASSLHWARAPAPGPAPSAPRRSCIGRALLRPRCCASDRAAAAAARHEQQHHQPPPSAQQAGAPCERGRATGASASGVLAMAAAVAATAWEPQAAAALQLEPANALSLPTWAIHVSSVAEWVIAMGLMWRYAEVSGNPRWKGMTWGMLPALGSAMSACTWHFFYNSPDLEFLVALQAFLTVVGNTTCLIAAYRIWDGARSESPAA